MSDNDRLPTVIAYREVVRSQSGAAEVVYRQVYAPVCPDCGEDGSTRWHRLPRMLNDDVQPSAFCNECSAYDDDDDEDGPSAFGLFYPSRLEAWKAREPERLEARLAELKKECAA